MSLSSSFSSGEGEVADYDRGQFNEDELVGDDPDLEVEEEETDWEEREESPDAESRRQSHGQAGPSGIPEGIITYAPLFRPPPNGFVSGKEASTYPSTTIPTDLKKWRRKYNFPEEVTTFVPRPEERADAPPDRCLAISRDHLECGVRFPLAPLLSNYLVSWGLAPGQVHPNAFANILGTMVLFHNYNLGVPTWDELNYLYKWKLTPGSTEQYYYFPVRRPGHKLVLGLKSSIKTWRDKWFWVGGNWPATEMVGQNRVFLPCPTFYGEPRGRPPYLHFA